MRSAETVIRPWLLAIGATLLGVIFAGCEGPRPMETVREAAELKYEVGDYEGAAVEYGELVERYPGNRGDQLSYGRCMLELGRYVEAEHAFRVCYAQRPGDPVVADALAESLYRQGDETRLFEFLRDRATATHAAEAYIRLARYAMETGDADGAREAIRTAIALDPLLADSYVFASALALRVGDTSEAVRRLRQAYGLRPGDEEIARRMRELGEVPGPTAALPPGP